MRGRKNRQPGLFYSINLKSLVPADHPLRGIKKLADEELARMSPKFNAAYSAVGRPSIPPEALIKATLLQVLYSIRSERKLCEEIGYNFLFRWFLDLAPDAPVMDIEVTEANGRSERQAAVVMLKRVKRRHWIKPSTLGEDAGYRGVEHTQELEQFGVTQHIAGIKGRKPRGWLASQRARRGIEKIFGWLKTVGGLKRTRFIERWKTKLYAQAAAATYNLMRLNNLGLAK